MSFSKQKRLLVAFSLHISKFQFQLIHCDLWGPFSTPTIEGFRFFLTIVDDFSKCTWVYLLKSKAKTSALIQQFSAMVKTQFDSKIRCIRSDNETKFIMKDLKKKTKSILYQLTYVDTPQQNAIIERKHQHILNVARALKFQSSLLLSLWGRGGCILTDVYLINRPSKILNNKSPYELLFNKLPSYDHLRTFGCLCFISHFPTIEISLLLEPRSMSSLVTLMVSKVIKFWSWKQILFLFPAILFSMSPSFPLLQFLLCPNWTLLFFLIPFLIMMLLFHTFLVLNL